jgi:hypothetical protein
MTKEVVVLSETEPGCCIVGTVSEKNDILHNEIAQPIFGRFANADVTSAG